MTKKRDVFIVDGARTPFLKARGKPGPFSAVDLAVQAGRELIHRQNFSTDLIDEMILGCVIPGPDEANISRITALRLGLPKNMPAWTVQRNCASGLQALDNATQDIATGRANIVLAGGTEAMSHAPVLFNQRMVKWLGAWMSARSFSQRAQLLTKVRLNFLTPIIGLLRGLSDPLLGLSMGQTAENIAYRFNLTREQMDAYASRCHQRLGKAMTDNLLDEIVTIIDHNGGVYNQDDGLRADTTIEKLAKLKPFFDKKYGMVTAGNSAQVTDGAALLILASGEAVEKHSLPVLGRVKAVHWTGLDPAEMGLGPAHAIAPLLKSQKLKIEDIDLWEINEAFAAQVLGCVAALNDDDYCRTHLKSRKALGLIEPEKLNIHGGGIAVGHPVGASGARITLHLLKALAASNQKLGVASLCIGGGQGGAMLLERGEA